MISSRIFIYSRKENDKHSYITLAFSLILFILNLSLNSPPTKRFCKRTFFRFFDQTNASRYSLNGNFWFLKTWEKKNQLKSSKHFIFKACFFHFQANIRTISSHVRARLIHLFFFSLSFLLCLTT